MIRKPRQELKKMLKKILLRMSVVSVELDYQSCYIYFKESGG